MRNRKAGEVGKVGKVGQVVKVGKEDNYDKLGKVVKVEHLYVSQMIRNFQKISNEFQNHPQLLNIF